MEFIRKTYFVILYVIIWYHNIYDFDAEKRFSAGFDKVFD